jgi:hypothetical protein
MTLLLHESADHGEDGLEARKPNNIDLEPETSTVGLVVRRARDEYREARRIIIADGQSSRQFAPYPLDPLIVFRFPRATSSQALLP